jgi:hypothetical protein
VKQYGYEEVDFEIDLREDHPLLRIELEPGPIALQGFEVIADRLALMKQRLQNRANAAPVSVRTMDQGKLMRSAARDMREMLWFEGGLTPADCSMRGFGGAATSFRAPPPGSSAMGSCVYRRGRATEPRVYIDEGYTIGGLDELATYPPTYFYRVEVYSSGSEIRAYTHWFMERMAQRPVALIPINLP